MPIETGHSAGWNEGDPEGQDIHLAGMQETKRNKTFSWLECRRPTGTGHSAGRNPGDPEGQVNSSGWNACDQEKQDI